MSLSSAAAAALGTVHERDFDDSASQASSSRASSKAPSVTDWEAADAAPEFVTIGTEHCRCVFKFRNVPHSLVCGNAAKTCRRDQHDSGDLKQAPPGVYKALLYRKHLNGIYDTYMSEDEFQKKDDRERLQLRDLALELGSKKFEAPPIESEWTFSKHEDVSADHDREADEPYDQKGSPPKKPAVSSQTLPVRSKSPSPMPMKPKVPDMSLPFPKKVSARSAAPVPAPAPAHSASDAQYAKMAGKLDEFSDGMEYIVKKLVSRMDDMDCRSNALEDQLTRDQRDTKKTLSALEKAMVDLAKAQTTQAARLAASAPAPTPVPTSTPFLFGPTLASVPNQPSAQTSSRNSTSTSAPSLSTPAPSTSGGFGTSGGTTGGHPGGRNQLPPTCLLGTDKSKEKDEVFGVQLRSEAQLKQDLSPPGVSADTRDDLAANMVDSVSLPGTFSGSEETSALDGTHQVAEAVRELLAQNRGGQTSERVRVDHGWRSMKRISLHAIKGADQLRTQYGNLTDISDEVLSHFLQSTLAILQAGRMTDFAAEQWSQNGFYWRLVRDSLTWYTDLHLHLLNINLNHGWERVQVELKYHCNKLWMIRSSASNRLVCLCKTYCYLRNGKRNHWTNDDLLSKRIDQMSMLLTKQPKRNQGVPGDKMDAGANLCRKCRTNCHAADVPCPWKNMKDADARKAAAAWMLNPVAPS